MASEKQRAAARKNVKKAQAGAQRKQTLKHLSKERAPRSARRPLRYGGATRRPAKELEEQARKLDIRGRSKMGKAELKRAVARAS